MSITRRGSRLLLLIVLVGAGLAGARPRPALAAPCDPPVLNPIVCENSKTGNPKSEWDIISAGDTTIQGYATEISVNKGQTVLFKVNTPAAAYRFDIYRLGYYGGQGARKWDTVLPSATLPQIQPSCLTQPATGLIDCGNWNVSGSWSVPADAVSGVYLAKLVRTDTGGSSHIVFIVRDDSSNSDLLFQMADPTWQAYNNYGGKSLYDFNSPGGRAYKVSYNRPFSSRGATGGPRESWLFNAEYPMLRWLERNGYNVSYTSGIESDRRGAELLEHDVFLSVGHDEYWSGQQRANVEAARNAGVHLGFFSGNDVFWKTRWEASIDGASTPYRTLVCYKETIPGAKIDPSPEWTGTWRDPRLSPPSDGGRPENALTGTLFTVNGPRGDAMLVPAAEGKLRFWRNTSVATLPTGGVATLPAGTLGFEWNEDIDNGFRPAGLMQLSSTTLDVGGYIEGYGHAYGGFARATHSMTLYRHGSGARVFSAGTVQWSWGLDDVHDMLTPAPDARMQQATVNLFADMGVQPATLQAGLAAATASTDTIAPTATITSPANGATLAAGQPVTITGTASDSGGVVGGVEISIDGGTTWRRASGRASWSYSWTPDGMGSFTLRARAADDSGNIGAPSAAVTVTSTSAAITFNELTPVNRALNGQYPAGVIDWGTDKWYLSGPYGAATTNSVSFNVYGTPSTTFAFVTPQRLFSVQAINVGGSASTITLACAGNPTKTQNVGAGQTATISTGWSAGCTTVTVGSSNGWDTNFDTFIYGAPGPDTTAPTISGVQEAGITGTGATITWTTDEASDSQVEYGTTESYGSATTLNPAMVTSHSQALAGLTANTLYHYRVKSRDAAGNLATSADGTFTTLAVDGTPPVISAVQAAGVTSSGATVSWTTNEASDTQVEYGTTTSYGQSTTLNTSMVTSHSQTLGGLTANTLYHYRVKSRDAAGNLATSADFTFTTATSSPQGTVTFDDRAGQDQALNGQYPAGVIDWGSGAWYHSGPWGPITTKSASFEGPGVTSRSFTFVTPRRLVQLEAGNSGGGTATVTLSCTGQTTKTQSVPAGQKVTITTGWSGTCAAVTVGSSNGWDTNFDDLVHDGGSSGPDTTAPTISAVAATSITGTGATISWTTNEASDTQVEYGTTTSYGQSTTLNTSMVTSHSQALSGLTANTLYHYRVKSRDAAGNLATSADGTFTTMVVDTTPPVISAVQATAVTSSGATITWTTNEASDSQVEYGPTVTYGSSTTLAPAMVTSHSVPLGGLTANTLYHYRVKSKDAAGNLATSADGTFTTTAGLPTQTVTFDDRAGQDQPLDGQYPTGVINWGTGVWYHSGPWGAFTTKSISFDGGAQTSGSFTFVTARRLVSLEAYNGGGSGTTVTLACAGQTTKSATLTAGQKLTISTGWTGTCTTVTITSSNGWNTNFDTLVHDGGPVATGPEENDADAATTVNDVAMVALDAGFAIAERPGR